MKNNKFYEFGAGRVGNGKVDLETGNLTLVHSTADLLNHVYNDSSWKLNLHQRLQQKNNKWIYTDGLGEKRTFAEKFFERREDGTRQFLPLTRSQIRITQDGRLWTRTNPRREVFSELVTDEGLILHIRPDGFYGSKKIESRHEELMRVQDEIRAISQNISDIKLALEVALDESARNSLLRKLNVSSIDGMTEKQIHNINLSEFDAREKRELLVLLRQRFSGLVRKGFHQTRRTITTGNNTLESINPMLRNYGGRARYAIDNNISAFTYNDNDGRSMDTFSQVAQHSGAHHSPTDTSEGRMFGQLIFSTRFNEKVGMIRQKIDDLTRSAQETRALDDLVILEKRLAQRKFIEVQLVTQFPVSYVVGEKTLGFNAAGDLVAIFDNYDNQIAIIYQDDRIVRLIDDQEREITLEYVNGRLEWIKDMQDQKTYLKYDGEMISEIRYPNGDVSKFQYDNGKLVEALSPSRLGVKITWNPSNKVSLISNLTRRSDEAQTENLVSFRYNEGTTVIDEKTRDRVTYTFKDGQVVTEYIQGKFDQYIITTQRSQREIKVTRKNLNTKKEAWMFEEREPNWIGENLVRFIRTSEGDEEKIFYKDFPDGRSRRVTRREITMNGRTTWQEFHYNKRGSITRTISCNGMINETKFDENGNVVETSTYHRSSPATRFTNKRSPS